MCLLSLFFGLVVGDLLLDVGLGDEVLGGDLAVLDLLLGGGTFQVIFPWCSVPSHCWSWRSKRIILLASFLF